MEQNELNAKIARELLLYDQNTGVLLWRVSRGQMLAGDRAGYRKPSCGYRTILINRRRYQEHRIAWLIYHGEWPKHQLDHINGIRDDNRISNLREATPSENRQNIKKVVSNSGFMGVTWNKAVGKWQAAIKLNGKNMHLGVFKTAEDASVAYLKAKSSLHSFYVVDSVMRLRENA